MYTLVTKNNISEYKDFLMEIESLYFENDWSAIETAVDDGRVSFLVYSHKELGPIGGAKITNPDNAHKVRQYFNERGYLVEDCWVLEDVFFHIADESAIHEDPEQFDAIAQKFYTSLYDVVQLQGQQNQKTAFITLNTLEEHEDIKHFGQWPFIVEHKMSDTDSEEVLGLLPIVSSMCATA
jgi:hypothetical protein